MKIIELQASNIKRLTAVTIRPEGNMVEITGKNGNGKTSVLDSIWWALDGKENIQTDPIRTGAESARIRLDLGELVVTRTFKAPKATEEGASAGDPYTTSVIVESADGARFQSPQRVLDDLLGSLTFDPLAFTRMKPGEQFETLKRFVPGVDFASIEKANSIDYDRRAGLNQRVKQLRAQAAGLVDPKVPDDLPKEPVDESALVAELEAAGKANTMLENQRLSRQSLESNVRQWLTIEKDFACDIVNLKAKLTAAEQACFDVARKREAVQEKLARAEALPAPIDTAPIREKIARARSTYMMIMDVRRVVEGRARLEEQAAGFEKAAEELTAAMKARDKVKADAIAAAKMPIEGLGLSAGQVLMKGVPFNQASDAEQLRASIAIAAAMNPKLRVIRVRDGSLLDEDGMKLLAQFADEHDMQVWIERVDSSGKVGFVIEDGHLKETT